MRFRERLAAAFLALVMAVSASGCGPDLVIGGALPATPTASMTPTVTCVPSGGFCTFNQDCCSGACNTIIGQCQ